MKKLLVAAVALCCASVMMVQAEEAAPKKEAKEKKVLTAEQQALRKEMVAKYDANKDGKLDKMERAAMSKEDQEKMEKAGLNRGKKKTPAADAPKADEAK